LLTFCVILEPPPSESLCIMIKKINLRSLCRHRLGGLCLWKSVLTVWL
jgi:hypothetical protein